MEWCEKRATTDDDDKPFVLRLKHSGKGEAAMWTAEANIIVAKETPTHVTYYLRAIIEKRRSVH